MSSVTTRNAQALEKAAVKAARKNGCLCGGLQSVDADTHDETSDAYMTGSIPKGGAATELKRRFLSRLADAASGFNNWNEPAIALMKEDSSKDQVLIWLAGLHENASLEQKEMLRSIAATLQCMHLQTDSGSKGYPRVPQPTRAQEKGIQANERLWRLVCSLYASRLPRYVKHLRAAFEQHEQAIDDMVTNLFGVLGEAHAGVDYELGDRLLSLRNQTCGAPMEQLSTADLDDLVCKAAMILQLPFVDDRFRRILGRSMVSNSLRKSLLEMASPKRTFDTAVRTSCTFSTFRSVEVHLGLPSSKPGEVIPPVPNAMRPSTQVIINRPKSVKGYEVVVTKNSTEDLIPCFIQPAVAYLDRNDRTNYNHLMPLAKQYTFELIVSLLNRENPAPWTAAYSIFGYPAASDDDEVMALGRVYATLLHVDNLKRKVFAELWGAAETNTLVDYLNQRGWACFLREKPPIEHYLRTPAHMRESVWTLIQFLRDEEATEPPRSSKRDYGMQLCKTREEVLVLKQMLRQLLNVLGPLGLHKACVSGRLEEEALRAERVEVKPKYRRLLRTYYRYPGVGYESFNNEHEFSGSLFKRPLRRLKSPSLQRASRGIISL